VSHFTELNNELEKYLDEKSVEKIHQAYCFAAKAHEGQQRHSGDPYITHPLAVGHILAEMRMDAATIIAAILHDVIEDTPIEKSVIAEKFSAEVAELVDGVSKLAQIKFRSKAEAQAESFRKMLLAMAKDIRVILIKLADRLHNMRTIGSVPPEKRRRIAHETLDIYSPIASRLGMHAFRVEFEELGFAALFPSRHRILQEAVRKVKRSNKTMIGHLENTLKECLEKNNLPPSLVWGRTKHLYSIYKEMKEKHLSFNQVMDVYTFCIVVDRIDTCYRTLGAVHNLYKPLPEKFRDYIALPKANGYQALHTALFSPYGFPIAIQIRTVEMDNKADNGIATQWRSDVSEEAEDPAHIRANEWLRRLLDIQQTTPENPLEFIENVKIDLVPEEVYVFTPDGDILELPQGSTAIDFAYAVHSAVGNACVGVRIDRKELPLSTPLSNGQTIEIITNQNAKPNPAWLHFVVTGKARSNIRNFLKNQHQNEAIEFGKRLLDIALNSLQKAWSDLAEKNIKTVLHQFNYQTEQELFEAIGLGLQIAPLVAQKLVNHNNKKEKTATEAQPLFIQGTEGVLVQFANCCYPIPGDSVIGILQSGHGLMVHEKDCRHIMKLCKRHPEQCVPVSWSNQIQGFFKTEIRIEVANQQGVLAQLASATALAKANIDNVSVEQRENNYCIVTLTVSVHNRVHLAEVMRRLRMIKTVTKLARGKS
jgi:guanosine-3',5'-bis(diphosphate) 3'-pyrophosphohydrolase